MNKTKVYAIRFTGDTDYTGVAVSCQIWDEPDFKGLCFITPPDRPHMISGAVTKETPHGFMYKSTGFMPGEWEFQFLTIENFRKRFYKLVIGGDEIAKSLNTTEELEDWFNSRFGV